MRTYVDRMWIYGGKATFIRFQAAYNLDEEAAFTATDEKLKTALKNRLRGGSVALARIQAKEVVEAGSFLGSHPNVYNRVNWEMAFDQFTPLAGTPLEFRTGDFKVRKTNPGSRGDYCPIVSIWADKKKVAWVRKQLLQVTSSRSEVQLPLGLAVRFIPCVTDESMVISTAGRTMAIRARAKQKKFTQKTGIMSSEEIMGLDFVISEIRGGVSCREALMALRSRRNPDMNLFLMVEEDWDSPGTVRFLHHASVEDECMEVIPALGLVLEKELSTSRVWKWFSNKMRDDCAAFNYNAERGVHDPDDKGGDNKQEWSHWDSLLGEDSDDDDIPNHGAAIITGTGRLSNLNFDGKPRNAFDDNGTIQTNALRALVDDPSASSSIGASPNTAATAASTEASSLTSTAGKLDQAAVEQYLEQNPSLLQKILDAAGPQSGGVGT